MNKKSHTIINSQTGDLAFKLFEFDDNSHFDHLQRNSFYTLVWVKVGQGLVRADFTEYSFESNSLFAFAPYQPFLISTNEPLSGYCIQFHSDFYCIHRNPKETNCDTTLFNNVYQPPLMKLGHATESKLKMVIDQLKEELKGEDKEYELIVPFLKIILVELSRVKSLDHSTLPKFTDSEMPHILGDLKKAIEENFRDKHSASDYADLLNISSDSLAKTVKKHFNKTLTDLITDRIIVEAKRELYMTTKPIKEIAWHLGYADEFYFSRLFKNKTETSPQSYRDTVGFGKAEVA